ncbi:MAG: hypothetical protein LBR34_06585 [Prevotella sp.]|jgi:hypothetical protein|nr:hypothetical protein [Prevotella sp.]
MKSIFKVMIALLATVSVFSACSSDDDETTTTYYTIGINSMSVSGSGFGYLTILNNAEQQYERTFSLKGNKKDCDAEAKVRFAAAMDIVEAAAKTVTDANGTVEYILQSNTETIDTKTITVGQQ